MPHFCTLDKSSKKQTLFLVSTKQKERSLNWPKYKCKGLEGMSKHSSNMLQFIIILWAFNMEERKSKKKKKNVIIMWKQISLHQSLTSISQWSVIKVNPLRKMKKFIFNMVVSLIEHYYCVMVSVYRTTSTSMFGLERLCISKLGSIMTFLSKYVARVCQLFLKLNWNQTYLIVNLYCCLGLTGGKCMELFRKTHIKTCSSYLVSKIFPQNLLFYRKWLNSTKRKKSSTVITMAERILT